ncbi:hypothetical protein NUU61_000282 [Penicillium alfredii]|uniref:Uncharacterized protein n=1 Tax=Penicillium alfredii TaxID=1506179 RepID=A0A9W9KQX5_9EURO|nr:uncharacterized protein NUU61_000282 [Penicillium alfredii]KAJ5114523.1 hypothetical protein NUU61_000282 [Penicillium alfredii]
MLLCDEAIDDKEFERICAEVASTMTIHIDFVSLLHLIANSKNARAVVVTCGIRRIWDMILERERLTDTVEVIGGGRLVDGFVVTPVVKMVVVNRLRSFHCARVWGFGDSPLDLDMLQMANGERGYRRDWQQGHPQPEHGYDARDALDNQGFRPFGHDRHRLPLVDITAPNFVATILGQEKQDPVRVIHATKRAAVKLLSTPMRNKSLPDPTLHKTYQDAEWYLGIELLADLIGFKTFQSHTPKAISQTDTDSSTKKRHWSWASCAAASRSPWA